MKRPSVCLVSAGLSPANLRLQPWKYLVEIARGLARSGCQVTLLTDSPVSAPLGKTEGPALITVLIK